MNHIIENRFTASLVHLLISVIVLISILALTYLFWYPGELIHAGAITGLRIIIAVDIVLGPLLTLVVFDRKKQNLMFDLLIIAIIQLSCLIYGLWLLTNERPVAQVLADDGIYLITKAELDQFEISLPETESNTTPPAYILELPDDWSSLPGLKFTTELVSEKPFAYRQDLYESFDEITERKYDLRVSKILENLTFKPGQNDETTDACRWLPVHSKHTAGSACVNFESGIILLSEHTSIF